MGRNEGKGESARRTGGFEVLDDRTAFSWEDAAEAKTDEAVTIIKRMIEWFLNKYEDPAESTPYCSAEGGYQCELYGAYEEISGHFIDAEGAFSEAEWEEIVGAAVDENA
jgi:hypothetical protein